jgi:hypothetical protein
MCRAILQSAACFLHCLLAHYHIKSTNFGEDLLNTNCVFLIAAQVCLEKFSF